MRVTGTIHMIMIIIDNSIGINYNLELSIMIRSIDVTILSITLEASFRIVYLHSIRHTSLPLVWAPTLLANIILALKTCQMLTILH